MEEIKHSVLIIDDQETSISMLSCILSSEYIIFSAGNGRDGIEAAKNCSPDIILLDVLMTDMDGYEVIAELKSSEETKKIPVIFITSLISHTDEEKALTLGAADYITKPFSPAIVRLRLKYQIKILTQLQTIERFSMLDQLTEIPNRRSFDIQIKKEWARSLREKTTFSILMIDLDNFKRYNDTYGHLQGDVVLKEVVKVFSKVLKRPGDFAARWGGEEFVILLPCTELHGAFDIAEQIRKGVESMDILLDDNTVTKMTISIGVNTHEYEHGGTIDEFISNADKALYEAKDKGRNLVCVYGK
ncbi:MAG: diguanylate cyclase [Treponema sp.]|nr:diguanylate cyclase [Treponema sp.]